MDGRIQITLTVETYKFTTFREKLSKMTAGKVGPTDAIQWQLGKLLNDDTVTITKTTEEY